MPAPGLCNGHEVTLDGCTCCTTDGSGVGKAADCAAGGGVCQLDGPCSGSDASTPGGDCGNCCTNSASGPIPTGAVTSCQSQGGYCSTGVCVAGPGEPGPSTCPVCCPAVTQF
jgi:hypothetical protein